MKMGIDYRLTTNWASSNHHAKVRLLWLMGFLICIIGAGNAASNGYELSGDIIYTGSRSNKFSKSFYVTFDNCLWSIVTSNSIGTTNAGYNSASFDGTNIYRVDFFGNRESTTAFKLHNGKLQEEKLAVPVKPKNRAAMIISSNDMPSFDGSLIAPLWLAFASGCVLDSIGSKSGLLTPVWATGNPAKSSLAMAEWSRHDQEPRLPTKVTYRNTGKISVYDELSKSEREVQLAGPYKTGYTEAVLEARDFRVEADLLYPLVVRLEQFGRKASPADNSDVQLISAIDISVKKFNKYNGVITLKTNEKTVIVDNRIGLSNGNQFAYFSSNGAIVPPEKLVQSRQFIKQMRAIESPKSGQLQRYIVIGIMFTSFGGLCYFIARNRTKK